MNDLLTSGRPGALTSLILVLKLKFLKVSVGERLPLPGPQFPFSSLDCEPTEFLICSLDCSELKVVCKVTPFSKTLGTTRNREGRLWGQIPTLPHTCSEKGLGDSTQ